MNIRTLSTSMVLVLGFCTSAAFAAPFASHRAADEAPKTITSAPSHGKKVKLTLRNDSKATMNITVAGTPVSLAPGATQNATLHAGDQILAENGTVLTVVDPMMNEATVGLH